jgi:hypothetical protein
MEKIFSSIKTLINYFYPNTEFRIEERITSIAK